MMKFDSHSADTFGQVDLIVNKPGIPKVALLSPRLKHSLVACGEAALLAFAVGLLVAVFGALAADEPARPRPTAERAGADSARLQPAAEQFAPPTACSMAPLTSPERSCSRSQTDRSASRQPAVSGSTRAKASELLGFAL
jgi:hypothetical protein